MKCPWCWKKIDVLKRVDRDPTVPVASVDGAPFLCHGCKQLSIVIGAGDRAVSLRKPTAIEAAELARSQQLANQIPGGELTPEEIDRVAADFHRHGKKTH
jgi:hypothetical protein